MTVSAQLLVSGHTSSGMLHAIYRNYLRPHLVNVFLTDTQGTSFAKFFGVDIEFAMNLVSEQILAELRDTEYLDDDEEALAQFPSS